MSKYNFWYLVGSVKFILEYPGRSSGWVKLKAMYCYL